MQHKSYATDGDPIWFTSAAPWAGLRLVIAVLRQVGRQLDSYDVFSTAVHEIGHLLGLINGLTAVDTEVLDGDYDLPPGLMNGDTVGCPHGRAAALRRESTSTLTFGRPRH